MPDKIDGESITLAVLDSVSQKNFIDGKQDNYWYTNHEQHGTVVTGIVVIYAPKMCPMKGVSNQKLSPKYFSQ